MSAEQSKKAAQTLIQELFGIFWSYLQTYLVAFVSFCLLFVIYAGIKTIAVVQIIATVATFLSAAFTLFVLLLYLDQKEKKRDSSKVANSKTVAHTTAHSGSLVSSTPVQQPPKESDSDVSTFSVTLSNTHSHEIHFTEEDARILFVTLHLKMESLPEPERVSFLRQFQDYDFIKAIVREQIATRYSNIAFTDVISQFARRALGFSDQVMHRDRN
jgi:hypothetical protein